MTPRLILIAFVAVLAGCGSESPGGRTALGTAIEGLVAQRQLANSDRAKAPQITRAMLDQVDSPALQLDFEQEGARAITYLSAVRGDVEIWRAIEESTWSLKDGVLIQTRGTTEDLMSSNAGIVFQAFRNGQANGQRRYTFLTGDFVEDRRIFDCTIRRVGAQTLNVVERNYSTIRYDETCTDGSTTFTNSYWRDAGGSTMRRSEQWAGPFLGQVIFTRLI